MSLKLTAASFLNGVRQSGLIEPDKLESLVREFQQSGIDCGDSRSLADALVQREALTKWQADKLLQGRHKGFLLGRYKLMSLLGTGEMSAVFLARHTLMGHLCAIKVLPGNKVQDTSYLGRFYREARAVASLNHPNIVRAFDVDKQVDGPSELHYFVMEYVEGKNLEKMVQEKGKLDVLAAADIVRQAAAGLSHAHQSGLVHRDVKPQNVLVDSQGRVKMLDLGLARFFKSDSHEESLTIKHDEKVLGTADFLAPEQAVDSHNVDARADVYSLGCTLYFALAGHPPFIDGTLVQRLLAHQTRMPTPISAIRPETPAPLAQAVDKMMAKRPIDRFQNMAQVADALGRFLVSSANESWKRSHTELVAQFAPAVVPVAATRTVAAQASAESSRSGSPASHAVATATGSSQDQVSSVDTAINEVLGLVSELSDADAPNTPQNDRPRAAPRPKPSTGESARPPAAARPAAKPAPRRTTPAAEITQRPAVTPAEPVVTRPPAQPTFREMSSRWWQSVPWPLVGMVTLAVTLLTGISWLLLRGTLP